MQIKNIAQNIQHLSWNYQISISSAAISWKIWTKEYCQQGYCHIMQESIMDLHKKKIVKHPCKLGAMLELDILRKVQ